MTLLRFLSGLALALLLAGPLRAQLAPGQPGRGCAADEMLQTALRNDPGARARCEALETFTRSFVQNQVGFRAPRNGRYVIPVVFHIIHEGGTENVSRAQILDALRILNEDFNFRTPDTALIPPPFRPLAADIQVEFRLATRDPEGRCTDGINRVFSEWTNFTSSHPDSREDVRRLIAWPSDRYLNIWVVKTVNLLNPELSIYGAFATFPGVDPARDGVVITPNDLGSIELALVNTTGDFHLLSHEVGHWLNLLHIWGRASDPYCESTDLVEDTPPQEGPTPFECPDFPTISCDNGPHGDMFVNFMDYSICTGMFTLGQRDRMWAALEAPAGGRNKLWTEENLIATGTDEARDDFTCPLPPRADFAVGDKDESYLFTPLHCGSATVAFHDVSGPGRPTSWRWSFEGGAPATSREQNPVVSFPEPGKYRVTLIAGNEYGADTLTRDIDVFIFPAEPRYPTGQLVEDFESTPRNAFYTIDIDRQSTWQVTDVTPAFSGRKAAVLTIPTSIEKGGVDYFITPGFDLSQVRGEATLTFQLSFGRRQALEEWLVIFAFTDCHYDKAVFLGVYEQDQLATIPGFGTFPAPTTDSWRKFSLPLPEQLLGRPNVKFVFRWDHDPAWTSNPVFLDDIAIESGTITGLEPVGLYRMAVYPNPVREAFTVQLPAALPAPAPYRLLNAVGQPVRSGTLTAATETLPVAGLPAGIYTLHVQQGARRLQTRLAVAGND